MDRNFSKKTHAPQNVFFQTMQPLKKNFFHTQQRISWESLEVNKLREDHPLYSIVVRDCLLRKDIYRHFNKRLMIALRLLVLCVQRQTIVQAQIFINFCMNL